jgi:general secretion pathway protein A
MYLDYYGFTEKPFSITPNPHFIFFSKIHKEAFALLLYGINKRFGFIELIGEVGTGKTTVLRTLLGQLDEEHYRTALIFNPTLSAVDLMRAINREFGISAGSGNVAELLAELDQFLLREHAAGRTVVLVVDEAQNLAPDVLEQIRLISNLETETDKLIQIVLAGQPELARLLERPELRQINQRIALRYRLRPLDREDSRTYIEHRLAVAGGRDKVSFSAAARWWLYRLSRGTPRLINMLCDRALLIGYTEEKRKISGRIVSWAYKDIMLKPVFGSAAFRRGGILALALVILAFVYAPYFQGHKPAGATSPRPLVAVARDGAGQLALPVPLAPAGQRTPAELKQALRNELTLLSETRMALSAFNALAPLWHVPAIGRLNEKLAVVNELKRQAEKRGLLLTPFSGSLDDLLRLDTPALLPLAGKSATGAIIVALTGSRDGALLISPQLLGRGSFSKTELGAIWPGRAYILWRNAERIPLRMASEARGERVRKLQGLLRVAGCRAVTVTGVYDGLTVKAVEEFQGSRGLKKTGMVSPVTLIHLYKAAKGAALPSLAERKKAGGL